MFLQCDCLIGMMTRLIESHDPPVSFWEIYPYRALGRGGCINPSIAVSVHRMVDDFEGVVTSSARVSSNVSHEEARQFVLDLLEGLDEHCEHPDPEKFGECLSRVVDGEDADSLNWPQPLTLSDVPRARRRCLWEDFFGPLPVVGDASGESKGD